MAAESSDASEATYATAMSIAAWYLTVTEAFDQVHCTERLGGAPVPASDDEDRRCRAHAALVWERAERLSVVLGVGAATMRRARHAIGRFRGDGLDEIARHHAVLEAESRYVAETCARWHLSPQLTAALVHAARGGAFVLANAFRCEVHRARAEDTVALTLAGFREDHGYWTWNPSGR